MALLGGVGTPVTGCDGGGPGAGTHPFHNEPLVMVAANHGHVVTVTDRGGVWVWGLGHRSQLGPIPMLPGEPNFRAIPARWDSSVCSGSPVVMVACGDAYTLALTRAGHVWSCGYASYGQTDQAGPVPADVLTQVPCVECITMVAIYVCIYIYMYIWVHTYIYIYV